MLQTISQAMTAEVSPLKWGNRLPAEGALAALIHFSVQRRQHGDKTYRDEIVHFEASDELSAWAKVKEMYDLNSPENKPLTITRIKSQLYPTYSFANTYSQDWYYVLHWRMPSMEDAATASF